ncbi:MAG: hypothetical protein U0325_33605 [Polyangiales bacterium]
MSMTRRTRNLFRGFHESIHAAKRAMPARSASPLSAPHPSRSPTRCTKTSCWKFDGVAWPAPKASPWRTHSA